MPHFICVHDIKQKEEWDKINADLAKREAFLKAIGESKFTGKQCYSLDIKDKHFCLWHVAAEEDIKDFPAFFYENLASEAIAGIPKVWIISDQSLGLPDHGEFYEQKGATTFAFVHHQFTDGAKAHDCLEQWLSKGPEGMEKHNMAHGFWNHAYLPCAGSSASTDAFCLWELSEGKTKEDLKTYLDTYLLKADSTDNVVYLCNETSGYNFNLPTPKFPAAA